MQPFLENVMIMYIMDAFYLSNIDRYSSPYTCTQFPLVFFLSHFLLSTMKGLFLFRFSMWQCDYFPHKTIIIHLLCVKCWLIMLKTKLINHGPHRPNQNNWEMWGEFISRILCWLTSIHYWMGYVPHLD